MQPPFAALAMSLAAVLLGLSPSAGAQKAAEPPQDPVAAAWVWLADAPVHEGGLLTIDLGPGLDALDHEIQDLDTRNPQPLARADLAARLSAQLATLPPDERAGLLEHLAEHEGLATEVAFLLGPDDDIPQAYRILSRLFDAHGGLVADLAPLAAAICAVHDQPRNRRVNENTVALIDPVELFAYYAANERAMHFSPRGAPAEILIHLADATGSIQELDWARKRYGRDKNVGNRYHEITYDTRALRQEGVEKRVTEAGGYSLQSIRQYGGVCADQAYFAQSVGKACGIPACSVVGKGGEVSHAWVGFLEQAGRTGVRWNFTAGRYEDYEDVRGAVQDPQTGRRVPDAFLTIVATTAAITPERRRQSVALADAARRIGYIAWTAGGEEAITPELITRQIDLLEASLRLNPGNLDAWLFARNVVASPLASLAQRERWAQAVDQVAGQASPDFAYEILTPIFASEQDPAVRFHLWDWAAQRFARRPDLAAAARVEQARIMVEQDRKTDAVAAARAVFDQYNAVDGLVLAEQLLNDLGRQAEVLDMYQQAFRRIRQPSRMQAAFLRQSAWFKVGNHYAELLDAAGNGREAERVRKRLGQ